MKKGDKIEITVAEEPYFKVGDTAILTEKDEGGDWWASFGKKELCLQKGISEFKVIK